MKDDLLVLFQWVCQKFMTEKAKLQAYGFSKDSAKLLLSYKLYTKNSNMFQI